MTQPVVLAQVRSDGAQFGESSTSTGTTSRPQLSGSSNRAAIKSSRNSTELLNLRREQVAAQCRAVVHLATNIALCHSDKATMLTLMDEGVMEVVGSSTARIMESLGDILNGMDAVEDADKWMDPIFDEAHRMFPAGHGGAR